MIELENLAPARLEQELADAREAYAVADYIDSLHDWIVARNAAAARIAAVEAELERRRIAAEREVK